ncbi:MAG: hypothetical protein P8N43_13520 [Alphaproteobacteria bacterium]|nr:hypothetical protein [Alphaproteobacteria bacterium]
MSFNVLLTCMGGYGALTLLEDFRKASIANEVNFIGTHLDKFLLSRSPEKTNYLVPSVVSEPEAYLEATKKIIEKEKIDLIIPKSDAEVKAIYPVLEEIGCKTFLPDRREIEGTQDKYAFYSILRNSQIPVADTRHISSIDEISSLLNVLPEVENRYWLRVKTAGTAGAYGATWVRTEAEAVDWIKRFIEKESVAVNEFVLSEFLPGRLFECLVLFRHGTLKLAKIYENLRFENGGDPQNYGVGSTPNLARTISDDLSKTALENAISAVELASRNLGTVPNGVYHMSAKENARGEPCITEVNIGRTPSTVSIFNRTGKYNLAEYFLNYALGLDIEDPEPKMDIEKDTLYAIRSLDQNLCLSTATDIDNISEI